MRTRRDRKTGPFRDVSNLVFFILALAVILLILIVMDPDIKRTIMKILP
jgi:hypothetical protein